MAAGVKTMNAKDVRSLVPLEFSADAGFHTRNKLLNSTPGSFSDIRLFLASSQVNRDASTPSVEVLRGAAVTQIKFHVPSDGKGWFTTPKRLVFGEHDLKDSLAETDDDEIRTSGNTKSKWADLDEEEEQEEEEVQVDHFTEMPTADPRGFMHLLLRIGDIETITVKASEVSWNGSSVERDFCVPLDRRLCVGDVVQRIKSADALEPEPQQMFVEESYDRLSVMYGGRVLPKHAVLGDVLEDFSLSGDTVMHLLVHRSAKIKVKYQQSGTMEVTISSGMSSDEITEKLRGSKGWRSSSSDLTSMDKARAMSSWNKSMSTTDLSAISTVDETPTVTSSVNKPMDITPRNPLCYRTNSIGSMRLLQDDAFHSSNSTNSTSLSESPLASTPVPLCQSIEQARAGLMQGRAPALAPAGTGGTYFLCNTDGSKVAVFKPVDEEPLAVNNPRGHIGPTAACEGLRKGTVVGEGAIREVAAYLLDHDNFSGVPPTTFAHIDGGKDGSDEKVEPKRGSLQQYVQCVGDCEEMGTASFNVEEVHKITVLDIRMANTDRNGGNILVREREPDESHPNGKYELVPIDHGYTLPHTLQDVSFEWEFWHQASMPFSESTLKYIAALDAEADLLKLAASGIDLPAECRLNFIVCTMLLKKGASAGLSPASIASVLTRKHTQQMSSIENILATAENVVGRGREEAFLEEVELLLEEYFKGLLEEELLDELEM
jgi:hypothetical protein